MEKYNYRESVMDCIIDYIKENNIVVTLENRIDLEEELNEKLWCND